MRIGVFCSANTQIDRDYFTYTREFGAWIATQGHTLVFGGCNKGLMECVAQAVKEHGGHTVGIIPSLVERGGFVSAYTDKKIYCRNLSERKDLLAAESDVLVALPGGIGTLDEIFTVAAASTIGYYRKLVILYDMKGFWQPLIQTLHQLQTQGFIRGNYLERIAVAHNLEELCQLLHQE